jgi:prephenate dehydrogenase
MTARKWNRVTVIGCGLIGASFALALRRGGACERIAGWDSSAAVLAEALERGIIDEIDQSLADGHVSQSDLFYLAMPVGEIIHFLRGRGCQTKRGAIITDAGSTKAQVCRAAREHLPEGRLFIGGHPVAGSHYAGLAHARHDLFAGAPYALITGDGGETDQALAAIKETVELLGARAVLTTALEHDRAMAVVSHLPQLLSSALAAAAREQPDVNALLDLAGPGYRDMTRLAASSWSMWRDILATNPAPVARALDVLIDKLVAVRDELQERSDCAGTDLTVTGALFKEPQQT